MRTRPLAAARSYLYVPGDRPDRLAKAIGLDADALIADLEDGVAPADKARARESVGEWLAAHAGDDSPQLWVRVDAATLDADIPAVISPSLIGVVVAKASHRALQVVDRMLSAGERAHGLRSGGIAVIPLIESASALLELTEIARSPRVLRIGLGEVDLTADLGVLPGPHSPELAQLRLMVVIASAAAGLARPVGPTSTAFRDLDAFRGTGVTLRRQGFRARTAIHPAQLPVIHEVFTPDRAETEAALDVLARHRAAREGVTTDADGRMIDAAVVRAAEETVARARQAEAASDPAGPTADS